MTADNHYPETVGDPRLNPEHRLWCYHEAIDDLHLATGDYYGTCPVCHSDPRGLELRMYARDTFDPRCRRCGAGKQQIEAAVDQVLATKKKQANGASASHQAPVSKNPQQQVQNPKAPRFPLLSLDEVRALPPPQWQVEDFCQEESLLQIYGQSNHYKSILTLDLALSMARGSESWFGRRILKPGPVVWVNADGGRGITDRVNAWVEANGSDFQHPFYTLMGNVRLNRPDETGPFRLQLETLMPPPVFVVFDTLSRCIPGVEENSQAEMTKVTEACHRMKTSLGATICLLHHTDKTGQWDRGSSIVKGEVDTQIRVTKDEGSRIGTVKCTKAREAEPFADFHFRPHRVGSSFVIVAEHAPPPETPAERREANIEEVYQCIREQPGINRERIALLLNMHARTVERHVNWLLMEHKVVEAELPRHEGQRGRSARGLFVNPGQLATGISDTDA